MHVKPDEKPLYNSRIIISYIRLLEVKYPDVDIGELLKSSGMKKYQIEDEGHWFTQKEVNLFHKNLQRLTNNDNIAREAGRFAASSYVVGTMKGYIMGFLGPAKTYELLGKLTTNFTRSSKYHAKRIGANRVEITVTPYKGVKEEPFQCENRIGYFEAVSQFFNYKPLKISHPQCLFRGDSCCRYIAGWQESKATIWKRIRNIFVLFLVIMNAAVFFIFHSIFFQILSLSLFMVLILNHFIEKKNINEVKSALFGLRDLSEDLIKQININYKNSMIINEIGQAVGNKYDLDEILGRITHILQNRLEYDRGMILLANDDRTKLIFHSGYGYSREQLNGLLDEDGFSLDGGEDESILCACFMNKTPILIDRNREALNNSILKRASLFAEIIGAESFILCPVIFENKAFGIIVVDNVVSKRVILQRDINILTGIAGQIGFIINNIKLVAMLNQAQKMEAIGTLAAGIAHDFNNILSSILGFSTLASDKLEKGSAAWGYIGNVIKAAERAKELVEHISTFSRQSEQNLKPVQVHEIVAEALILIRSSFPSTIKIEEDINIRDDYIFADPAQILQVVMNLLTNAADAINGKEGTIKITLEHINLSLPQSERAGGIKPGAYVKLTVSDTGHGIKRDIIKRIFEPFFTTKDIGKGTGMGLAVVHGIVTGYGGKIIVSDNNGKGAVFNVYLPKSDRKEEYEKNSDSALPLGNERILFIDDEDDIVFLGEKILESLGYNVTAVSDSIKALELFIENPENYDLLITDLTMPGMTGDKLIDEIRSLRPGMPVILCTGYLEKFAGEDKSRRDIELLLKPISRSRLARTVRKVLDKN